MQPYHSWVGTKHCRTHDRTRFFATRGLADRCAWCGRGQPQLVGLLTHNGWPSWGHETSKTPDPSIPSEDGLKPSRSIFDAASGEVPWNMTVFRAVGEAWFTHVFVVLLVHPTCRFLRNCTDKPRVRVENFHEGTRCLVSCTLIVPTLSAASRFLYIANRRLSWLTKLPF